MSLIIGHGNSVHDAAFALVNGDQVWAESVERHTQCKRALGQLGTFYSARPIARALPLVGARPGAVSGLKLVRSWALDDGALAAMRSSMGRPAQEQDAFLPWTAAAQAMDTTTAVQLAWVAAGLRPQPFLPGPGSARPEGFSRAVRPLWSEGPKLPEVTAINLRHHLAHAANAVFTSPFEECVVLVLDGAGEQTGLELFHFVGGQLRPLSTTSHAHSLGFLFGAVTELCGFSSWEGEEWKVMGLAAWGKPRPELREFFAARTRVDGVRVELAFEPDWPRRLEALERLRRPEDPVLHAADLAHNFQQVFSDTVVALVRNAFALGLSENLAYAGGCALNSSANGRIIRETGFKRLHVPCAPADDGNALGAALHERHLVAPSPTLWEPMSPYLGSDLDLEDLERALSLHAVRAKRYDNPDALCDVVAAMLAKQKIIGWMQGRAEYGPRALGNRSILADPRPPQMREWLNQRVKFREEYRPLAPSILHEHGAAWFDPYEESPYMERALPFRPEVRERVPAVVHADGTGRLQTVKRTSNPLFHGLLEAFHRQTGIPLLVNTSFNVMGRPIVHSVADALTVLHTTGLDALVIGPYVVMH